MRPLALVLLLALPAAAQKLPDAPASAKGHAVAPDDLKVSVADCQSEEDSARMEAAVRAAVKRVDSCLDGENKAIAGKIRSRFSKFRFHCSYKGGMAGGNTEHDDKGGADIFLNFRARGVQYSLAARTFHEMIHGTDPDGKLMVSAHTHAQAGYPDPVYACQLDCYPEGVSDDERKQIMRLGRALEEEGKTVPLADVKDCPAGLDCPTISAYTGICRGGKVLATKAMLAADKKARAPTCYAEALLNGCTASCKGAKGPFCAKACAFDKAADDEKGRLVNEYQRVGARLAKGDDGEALEAEDQALADDPRAKKPFAACR